MLQSLGLCIQVGHGGAPCPNPSPGLSDFCIFNILGIHYISINFCDFPTNGIIHSRTQLLLTCWFPATFNWPKTAFTFDCLNTFHELTLQGKTPLYDFYHMVLHNTDNLKLRKPIVHSSQALMSSRLKHSTALLSGVPPHISYLAQPSHAEASWPGPRPCGCLCNCTRRAGSRMPGMSSSWT